MFSDVITELDIHGWDDEISTSYDRDTRYNLGKHHLTLEDGVCKECPVKHKLKVAKSPDMNKVKACLKPTDKRLMITKRMAVAIVYGNGDLLVNPLVAQCPLCGTLVALGQLNSIVHKRCHLMEHIKTHQKKSGGKEMKGSFFNFVFSIF